MALVSASGHTTGVDERVESQRLPKRKRSLYAVAATGASLVLFLAVIYFTSGSRHLVSTTASGDLPSRLTGAEFWSMLTTFSEPDGFFRSDNFLSNETGFQEVIPGLKQSVKPGGVYIGVGPEQNFTYISAFQPRIAFIVDIRRQNMIEHLLYKAFIELAADRADFVSRLFARPRPPGLGSGSTAEELFRAFDATMPSRELFESGLRAAMDQLARDDIPASFLSTGDQKSMRKVYEAFFESGPDLSYTFLGAPQRAGRGGMPTYATLMTATDSFGTNWSYLATEDNFRNVQNLEKRNLIVPLVGNFAGDEALANIARYVNDHGAAVTTFYVSNVEQYLFQQNDEWSRFYTNVAMLPLLPSSMFIRSAVTGRVAFRQPGRSRSMLTTLTSPITSLVESFNAGQIHSYYDVVGR